MIVGVGDLLLVEPLLAVDAYVDDPANPSFDVTSNDLDVEYDLDSAGYTPSPGGGTISASDLAEGTHDIRIRLVDYPDHTYYARWAVPGAGDDSCPLGFVFEFRRYADPEHELSIATSDAVIEGVHVHKVTVSAGPEDVPTLGDLRGALEADGYALTMAEDDDAQELVMPPVPDSGGYPEDGAAMAAAIGGGGWTLGYLCDQVDEMEEDDLVPVFGAGNMEAYDTGSGNYGTAGPFGASDLAVTFAGGSVAGFNSGVIADGSGDLVFAAVLRLHASDASEQEVFSLSDGGVAPWLRLTQYDGNTLTLDADDGVDSFGVSITPTLDTWVVVVGVLDRSTDTLQAAWYDGSTSDIDGSAGNASAVGSLGSLTGALGASGAGLSGDFDCAALYIGEDATGLISGGLEAAAQALYETLDVEALTVAYGIWAADSEEDLVECADEEFSFPLANLALLSSAGWDDAPSSPMYDEDEPVAITGEVTGPCTCEDPATGGVYRTKGQLLGGML